MPEELVKTIARANLTNWFILPLIHLNQDSFGIGNFVESYVNVKGTIITVEVRSLMYLMEPMNDHKHFLKEMEGLNEGFIWFHLPSRWQPDFQKFKHGKYSCLSDRAKELIRSYGGGQDFRLLALDRDPILRQRWETELKLLPIPEEVDLLPVPSSNNYREVSGQ